MRTSDVVLASMILLLMAGCKETLPFKEAQPTTIIEPKDVKPHYYWRQGHWRYSRKGGALVWKEGRWINKSQRKHTKWVEGRWVQTARGKKYLEGHWE